MSPQWLPQNIQKRLLLYVLQQLSLFSEIDLPNLEEVSLNNIHLKDVSIDPEKIGRLPGCSVRYGQVADLAVTGGVMGGVNVEARGLEIVVAPNLDLQDSISKSVSFSLAQSTADLASTIMEDAAAELGSEQSDDDDDEPVSGRRGSSASAKPSALGGVMQRAVDMALSRLHIRVADIRLKIVSEVCDLVVLVDEAAVSTVNGTRSVQVSGVRVVAGASVNPGDSAVAHAAQDDDDETDGDADSDYTDPALSASMVFTHEEASSIYMSATAHSLQNSVKSETESPKPEPVILHLDTLDIEFEGLSNPHNVCVGLGRLTVACCPLIPTVLSVLNGVTRGLKLKSYQKKSTHATDKFPQYDDDDEINDIDDPNDDETQFFNKLHISTIIVSITSAIFHDGSFASPATNMFLELGNFTVKQKNDSLVYGGVESLLLKMTLNGTTEDVFRFENLDPTQADTPKADIRFEYFSKTDDSGAIINEITALFSKPAKLDLDAFSLNNIIELVKAIDVLSEGYASFQNTYNTYKALSNSNPVKPLVISENHIVVQTAQLELNLQMPDLRIVKVKVLPIAFSSASNELKCSKVLVDTVLDDKTARIGTISGISMSTLIKQFQGHMSHVSHFSQSIVLSTSKNVHIHKVEASIQSEDLKALIGQFSTLLQTDTSRKRYDLFIPLVQGSTINAWRQPRRKKVTINTTNYCDFRVSIEFVNFALNNVTPLLGSLTNHYSSVEIYKLNGEVLGHIKGAWLNRTLGDVNERVIYDYKDAKVSPTVLFHSKHNIFEVKLRNVMIEVYAYWQELFDKSPKEERTNEKKASDSKKTDIRVQLHDCAVGVSPNKLACKAVVALNKVHADIMVSNDKIYVKTTLRDLDLLLIDEVNHLKDPSTHSYLSVRQWFTHQGYLKTGNISNLHIGITVNLDEEKLGEVHKNQYNKLSIVDIKINLDELNLEVCGDSFYTLVQLINDLKIPLILKDKEKFKVTLDEELNLLDGIDFDAFKPKAPVEDFELIDDDRDDSIEIVDEYYDHRKASALSSQLEELRLDQSLKDSLDVQDNYFVGSKHKEASEINPVSININLGKVSLYMYDGYDWKETRRLIKGIVKKVEKESLDEETVEEDNDEVEIIEETLFESIHVTLPKGIDPKTLTKNINKQVQEEESQSSGYKDLKLKRSNRYKVLIELNNVDINLVIFTLRDPILEPTESEDFEVLNEMELLVDTLTIYDNLVNSSWNKYLTYMSTHGEKEVGKNMIKLNLLTLRDPPNLNFNETVIKLSLLPVRLFIDQDTNEFMGRFFKFKDERFKLPKLEEDLFIKKFEMVQLVFKIDYKPKKFNVVGFKNGEFNELLNLININGLGLSFSSIKLYGIKAIENLFVGLFKYWLPDIQKTQLINLFSGVDMFKPFINIGGSLKDMLVLPIKDYQANDFNNSVLYKSLNKNGLNFLKITSFELLKLGYKLTNGTQNILEQGEQILGGQGSKVRKAKPKSTVKPSKPESTSGTSLMERSIQLNKSIRVEDSIYDSKKFIREYDEENDVLSEEDLDEEQEKLISLYSNQPKNFKQGISKGYKAINKNLLLTKDEFLKIVEKMDDAENFESSLKVLLKKSPILLIRPMIGTTELISKTLMGLSNQIDSEEQIDSNDKYKNED